MMNFENIYHTNSFNVGIMQFDHNKLGYAEEFVYEINRRLTDPETEIGEWLSSQDPENKSWIPSYYYIMGRHDGVGKTAYYVNVNFSDPDQAAAFAIRFRGTPRILEKP